LGAIVHPYQRQIDLCNRALDRLVPHIPHDLFGDVYDYINRHHEWGLGMEILIDQLVEYEIKIASEQFDLILEAMASMGTDEYQGLVHLRDQIA
jgi:hypothetical protein